MQFIDNAIWLLAAFPLLCGMVSLLLPSPRLVLSAAAAGVLASAALDTLAVARVFARGAMASNGDWFRVDALSAFHLAVMIIVFAMSSIYAVSYFRNEPEDMQLNLASARRFSALWHGALAAMTLVLISNNIAIMWVGVEATTLLTAFLICLHISTVSLEATWKYLIVCSVGVAFAFMGVLLLAASAGANAAGASVMQWTHLQGIASGLDPRLARLSFIFLLVGYGTKAGLAPMHSWLPDAHSQAPAPVSAVFSGFMLNMALYCIMRHMPIVAQTAGNQHWAGNLLIFFGLASILIAAVFIISQHDLKRLLAYCSVEHIGIIALGLGLGGAGIFAALFHTLNHSLCKTLGFFSAGRIGQACHSHDMRQIRGAMRIDPLWGGGLFGSLLALIGVAPFAIFMSEFMLLKAAADSHRYIVIVVFLLGAGIVFVGVLRQAIEMAWGEKPQGAHGIKSSLAERIIVLATLALLILAGIWMPDFFRNALKAAAAVAGGGMP
ncbi:MAG: proton-conducting transporter membrane subunit [Kiritimatiellia bacterium]